MSKVEKGILYMYLMDDEALPSIKKHITKGYALKSEGLYVILDLKIDIEREVAFTYATKLSVREPVIAHEIFVAINIYDTFGRTK